MSKHKDNIGLTIDLLLAAFFVWLLYALVKSL